MILQDVQPSPHGHALAEVVAPAACVGAIILATALFPHSTDGKGAPATAPVTAPTLAAATLDRVRALIPGAATDFAGQDHWLPEIDTSGTAVAARFRFTPVATGDTGWIVVRVQAPAPSSARTSTTCPQGGGDLGHGATLGCTHERLPDGTVASRFTTRLPQADGSVLIEHTAEAVHDDVLVRVSATNTDDPRFGRAPGEDLAVSGRPALLAEQLQEIALWSGWGARLPAEYTEEGAELRQFDDSPQAW